MSEAATTSRPPRRPRRGGWIGYLFASPWLVGFFTLMLLPMVASLLLSFFEWDGLIQTSLGIAVVD